MLIYKRLLEWFLSCIPKWLEIKKNVNYFDWAMFNSYVAAMLVITRPGLLRCPIFRQKNSRGVFSSPASKDMRFPLLGSNTSLAVLAIHSSSTLKSYVKVMWGCTSIWLMMILWWFMDIFDGSLRKTGEIDKNQRFVWLQFWWTPLVLFFLCDWLANKCNHFDPSEGASSWNTGMIRYAWKCNVPSDPINIYICIYVYIYTLW